MNRHWRWTVSIHNKWVFWQPVKSRQNIGCGDASGNKHPLSMLCPMKLVTRERSGKQHFLPPARVCGSVSLVSLEKMAAHVHGTWMQGYCLLSMRVLSLCVKVIVHFDAKRHMTLCIFEVAVLGNAKDNCKPSLGVA